jgi:uncharacterized protein (DUF1501 family)
MKNMTQHNPRRDFLKLVASGAIAASAPTAWAANTPASNAAYKPIILIELKGANDGLNTWVPINDPAYYAARPTVAIPAVDVLPITAQFGLHPSLQGLKALWDTQQLAVIQGVGYPQTAARCYPPDGSPVPLL